MTAEQLKTIEAELQKRGYKNWTALTSSEDWAWFKTFGKKQDEDCEVTHGYQIAFRVWDGSKYLGCPKEHPYGFDFWTSALGADSRMNFEPNWEPIADIPTFERMTAEEKERMRKEYANTYPLDTDCGVANILIQGVLERIYGKDFFSRRRNEYGRLLRNSLTYRHCRECDCRKNR